MSTKNRIETLRHVISQSIVTPVGMGEAYVASLDAMDGNGFITARQAAEIIDAYRGRSKSMGPDDMVAAMLWELFADGAVTRYRVAGWWLAVEFDPDTRGPLVYFVRAGDSGPIKIGRSVDVGQRVSTLQTANHQALRVLATMRGGAEVEKMLHYIFEPQRISGEWFRPDLRLLTFIRELGGDV